MQNQRRNESVEECNYESQRLSDNRPKQSRCNHSPGSDAEAATAFLERKKQELNVSLNDKQTRAVLAADGPLLLLASPGSGKTTTIIMRIGFLIEVKRVAPARIKAVTFSKASATDMKERFAHFFPDLPQVAFSTIHSLAFEIMREHLWNTRTDFQIIEGEVATEEHQGEGQSQGQVQSRGQGQGNNQGNSQGNSQGQGMALLGAGREELPLHKKIILRELYEAETGERITDDQLEDLTTYISLVKNRMIPADKRSFVKCDVRQAEQVLARYEAFKRRDPRRLLIDFDDMLTLAHEALEVDPRLAAKFRSRYDYVLTDESQDTSLVQHAIVEHLVREHRNLFVVADDDQSIYSWRGADPTYLLAFEESYPGAVILFMEQNYRSSRDIVEVADRFIKRNRNRYAKNMFTHNAKHEPVQIHVFADYANQTAHVVERLQGSEKLEETAVLYRNNASSIVLMNELERAGIPFYIRDFDNRFFKHWIIEDILNIMRLTFADKRADILEKVHTKLNGYITRQQMAEVTELDNGESVFDNLLRYARLQDYQVKKIEETRDTLRQMSGMPPLATIQVIRGRLGYDKAIENICERLGFRREYLVGILNTLEEIADTLATMPEFAARLKHLEAVMKTAKRRKGQRAVTLSTFHSAKGLEFDQVYMIDLVEGIIPSPEDERGAAEIKEAQVEEAVRLFYVGMTRARTGLELLTYRQRDGARTKESRFVTAVRAIMNPPKAGAAKGGPGQSAGGQMRTSGRGSATSGMSAGYGESRSNAGGNSRPGQRGGSGAVSGKVTHSTRPPAVAQTPPNPNAIKDRGVLTVGAQVKHRTLGAGTVVSVTAERIQIRFDSAGEKTLALATCLVAGLLELG
jgi:DNA helicase-2/ATP-dependent DNA helicase PcrA